MRVSTPTILMASMAFTATASPSFPPCPNLYPSDDPSVALNRSAIANLFTHPVIPISPEHLADIEYIRATISRYALAIDGRNFAVFDSVFTTDAKANYSQVGYMDGVEAIKQNIEKSLKPFPLTQHNMGSSVIQLCTEQQHGEGQGAAVRDHNAEISAYSATYVMATHYQPGGEWPGVVPFDKVAMVPVMYQDVWRREEGEGGGITWKISRRNLLYMGALIGSVPGQ